MQKECCEKNAKKPKNEQEKKREKNPRMKAEKNKEFQNKNKT